MSKEKTYYVPRHTKLLEIASLFAEEFGHKKGSKAYLSYVNHFLDEALHNSILPGNGAEYAKNPKVADSTFSDDLGFFFGENSLIKQGLGVRGNKDLGEDKMRQLRGILTQLTHLYMETMLGVQVKAQYDGSGDVIPSDFQFPKGAETGDERVKDVLEFRYQRIFFLIAFTCAIRPVFEISKAESEEFFQKLEIESESVASLKSKEKRQNFIKAVFGFMSKKFGSIKILSKD